MSDPTPPVEHDLKIWPASFAEIRSGRKRHEVRRTRDRSFQVGDTLLLREWQVERRNLREGEEFAEAAHYTGQKIRVRVLSMTDPGTFGLPVDVCVMSIEVLAMGPR